MNTAFHGVNRCIVNALSAREFRKGNDYKWLQLISLWGSLDPWSLQGSWKISYPCRPAYRAPPCSLLSGRIKADHRSLTTFRLRPFKKGQPKKWRLKAGACPTS